MEEEEYEDKWEQWCSRYRAIDHAALQCCQNNNAPERKVYRLSSTRSIRINDVTYVPPPPPRRIAPTPPDVVDDKDEDVISLVVPASWNSESARMPR